MDAELIKKYIGKTCVVSTGGMGTSFKGVLGGFKDNWIELETVSKTELVNCDFIQNIKVLKSKA